MPGARGPDGGAGLRGGQPLQRPQGPQQAEKEQPAAGPGHGGRSLRPGRSPRPPAGPPALRRGE